MLLHVCVYLYVHADTLGKEVLKICILHCIYVHRSLQEHVCFTYARFTKVQLQKSKQGHESMKYRSCKNLYPYNVRMCYVHSYVGG